MNESETRAEHIDPALKAAGWAWRRPRILFSVSLQEKNRYVGGMKKSVLLDELLIWLRGRFTLTGEEKFWLLLVLIIVWTGLIARYVYLTNQKPEVLSPQEVRARMMDDK